MDAAMKRVLGIYQQRKKFLKKPKPIEDSLFESVKSWKVNKTLGNDVWAKTDEGIGEHLFQLVAIQKQQADAKAQEDRVTKLNAEQELLDREIGKGISTFIMKCIMATPKFRILKASKGVTEAHIYHFNRVAIFIRSLWNEEVVHKYRRNEITGNREKVRRWRCNTCDGKKIIKKEGANVMKVGGCNEDWRLPRYADVSVTDCVKCNKSGVDDDAKSRFLNYLKENSANLQI